MTAPPPYQTTSTGPPPQQMSASLTQNLGAVPAIAIRQVSQWGESIGQAFGIPWESKNKYKVLLPPNGTHVATEPDDPNRWRPRDEDFERLGLVSYVAEESGCFTRCLAACCGVGNLRPLTLHYQTARGHEYVANREFECGGACCCPLEMTMQQPVEGGGAAGAPGGPNSPLMAVTGRVIENFTPYCGKCMEACCTCTTYHDLQRPTGAGWDTRFTLRVSLCCCGRVNNCCAPTCCCHDAVYDILDAHGNVASTVQHTYAPGSGCVACCRMAQKFNNYLVAFPPAADPEDRLLITLAVLQLDYALFEKRGNEGQ